MSALQFTRLHYALSKKGGKAKNGATSADKQTADAIAHALKENWGVRDVKPKPQERTTLSKSGASVKVLN